MLMLEPADHCEHSTADIDEQEAGAGNVWREVVVGASNATASKGSTSEKRTSRKCSMCIGKPRSHFQRPNKSSDMTIGEACSPKALPEPLTPGGDLIVTMTYNLAPSSREQYQATDGLLTPTSTSSTTASSTRLPTLASPLQQLPPTMVRDDDLQTMQPCSGDLDLQIPHKDLPSSSSAPCLLEAGKKALMLGGKVGTKLALATPSY